MCKKKKATAEAKWWCYIKSIARLSGAKLKKQKRGEACRFASRRPDDCLLANPLKRWPMPKEIEIETVCVSRQQNLRPPSHRTVFLFKKCPPYIGKNFWCLVSPLSNVDGRVELKSMHNSFREGLTLQDMFSSYIFCQTRIGNYIYFNFFKVRERKAIAVARCGEVLGFFFSLFPGFLETFRMSWVCSQTI